MAKPSSPKSAANDTNLKTPMDAASATPATIEANGNGSLAKKAIRKKTAVKPEIVRTELRANLVPINIEDEIRQLAYLMSERRGFEPGHEADDWFAAEREVRQRYHQHSA